MGASCHSIVYTGLFLVRSWKRKALASLGDKATVRKMIPEVSFTRPGLKFIFFTLAFASLVIGAANPQIGTKVEEGKKSGADLMILLDVSNSMLAGDLSPNRLENAKRAISQLIDNLHNDRIGIIIFAGEAYVQLPITTDYSAAKLFLNNISTDIVPTQGTAIGAAIDMGMKSFDFVNGTSKAMVLMTDGENFEDDAIAAAKEQPTRMWQFMLLVLVLLKVHRFQFIRMVIRQVLEKMRMARRLLPS
ncbi:VWA domain-containing protein [Pedobacter steynii]